MDCLIDANAPVASKLKMSQQKLASRLPRGTRIDTTGTQLEVKGSRNYSPVPLFIQPDEMYEDVVLRGLRADGLSSKLGVKNNKDGIAKLISGLFQKDPRHDDVMVSFTTKRQKSNSAKNIFSTMTQHELKMLKNEVFPTKVDAEMRNNFSAIFAQHPQKLQNAVEVLKHIQTSFMNLDQQTELLALHNFQTRGFFADIISLMSDFLIQVLEDVLGFCTSEDYNAVKELQNTCKQKEDTTAAEILLSVGSDVQPIARSSERLRPVAPNVVMPNKEAVRIGVNSVLPRAEVDTSKGDPDQSKTWTKVGVIGSGKQSKYFLIKAPKEETESINTDKLFQLLTSQEDILLETSAQQEDIKTTNQSNIDVDLSSYCTDRNNIQLITSQPYINPSTSDNFHMTTLEISVQQSVPQDGKSVGGKLKRAAENESSLMSSIKRLKT